MEDVIHVDEKLFYMTTVKRRNVLLPDEAVPTRRVRSKRHIPKVMVLAAVARPRTDPRTGAFFDGKIGLWAFLTHEPAQRSSRNRPAGTLVPNEQSVNKSTYREMLVERVLPAIRTKWPGATSGERIVIQQDNAPPHISSDDAALRAAVTASGCNGDLRFQPPNSPDLNVLDLAIFNAIQARQQLDTASTLDELVANVMRAYEELPASTLNAAILTLQCSMYSCVAAGGNNDFKPRHMAKAKMEREGQLPRRIQCSPATASFVRNQARFGGSHHVKPNESYI
ncbi:hypothetical protein PF010_g14980 [Phytophthora fragariae]|uniref:Tc1-like transposase DDE domain-containing protein n=1 Tax=Phytophthora fragariae TaxID=53985 RepID=A0A6A3IXG3_9STRA|nr:hypothetical protein PF011_g20580 [Phytophthora fragariae]KAE9099987.1 hypothetical protein PF010_g14980 [Phytophthora fragariae]